MPWRCDLKDTDVCASGDKMMFCDTQTLEEVRPSAFTYSCEAGRGGDFVGPPERSAYYRYDRSVIELDGLLPWKYRFDEAAAEITPENDGCSEFFTQDELGCRDTCFNAYYQVNKACHPYGIVVGIRHVGQMPFSDDVLSQRELILSDEVGACAGIDHGQLLPCQHS